MLKPNKFRVIVERGKSLYYPQYFSRILRCWRNFREVGPNDTIYTLTYHRLDDARNFITEYKEGNASIIRIVWESNA